VTSTSAEPCLGIVDWGIGGVGLVRALDQRAPGLPLMYLADTGVTPYGRMGTEELTARLRTVVAALAERGATEVVLACNAASTVVGRLGATPVPV
jgi:glutamate racemase